MDKLRIFNANWSSRSAGPSLDNNRRVEIFLAGCQKAESGQPCKGCFNPDLWSRENCVAEQTPREAFEHIRKYAPNKYITFVGGEPLDQAEPLAELCRLLKEDGFHIIVITHYLGSDIKLWARARKFYGVLLNNIDGLVDGVYIEEFRIWDKEKAGDGLHDVIGSGNQCIWDFRRINRGETMGLVLAGDLECWAMNVNQDFVYIYKNEAWERLYGEKVAV